jgi:hypothetical protein
VCSFVGEYFSFVIVGALVDTLVGSFIFVGEYVRVIIVGEFSGLLVV